MAHGTHGTQSKVTRFPPAVQKLQHQVDDCERDLQEAQREKNDHKLLVALERSLHLKRKLFPEDSPEILAASQRLCQGCNSVATALLNEGELKAAHQLLQRAEEVAKGPLSCAMTWNNLACFYRHSKKLRSAIIYLEQTLAIEERYNDPAVVQTHLNLCATLSKLKRHSEALQQAQRALLKAYEALTPKLTSREELEQQELQEEVSLLCIAYHNQGVEHEHLKNFLAAYQAYARGNKWAYKFLGPSHQLGNLLHRAALLVKAKVPSNQQIELEELEGETSSIGSKSFTGSIFTATCGKY